MIFDTKNTFISKYKLITIFILAILYINVGITHFTNPDFFLVIVPDYLPYHLFIVYVSGLFEIILGFMLLFQQNKKICWDRTSFSFDFSVSS